MKAVALRPLALFTITFFVLSCILFTADTATRLWSAVIFIFLAILFLVLRFTLFRKRTLKRAVVVGLCFFLMGGALASVVSHYTFDVRYAPYLKLESMNAEFEGTVTDVSFDNGSYAGYTVKVEKAGELSDFKCNMTGEGGIEANMKIKGNASFYPFESESLSRYYISEGILLEAEAESLEIIGEGEGSVKSSS